ncbi:SCP [Nesidiocoris tenuis]|uniref:SCP n=1 Tax=Nesidiocoris tenuis TaxID=355587 RepID=A0ABN7B172_9HEMI|nr:SCP [Nesidiocoris tenuis]
MSRLAATVFLSSCLVFLTSTSDAQQVLRRGFKTEEQRKGIVEQHNQLRNYVASGGVPTQPQAQNMREMRWDEELAQQAQRWADRCVFEHDPNLVNRKNERVGQNLAIFRTNVKAKLDSPDFQNLIYGWFNEVFKFGYNGTFSFDSGHYSQMIWGKTYKIGCGYTGYSHKNLYNNYLVCNYYPAGNVQNSPPYEYGPHNCAENELFTSWRYSSLCTIDKQLINACSANWKSRSAQQDDSAQTTGTTGFETTMTESTVSS